MSITTEDLQKITETGVVNVAALARNSGVKVDTLRKRIERGTPMPPSDAYFIEHALKRAGLAVIANGDGGEDE